MTRTIRSLRIWICTKKHWTAKLLGKHWSPFLMFIPSMIPYPNISEEKEKSGTIEGKKSFR
ncbi:hypothetical protein LEP1GSC081_4137 [Leptospira kirschneri str. H1]|uniref:Uncharacterized protein n=1 Tax=Leptospira kirschneri str. H1 TaxID=1049966 RepID=A0A0E2B3U7_9LEPT|nr:hypothetical protein LEP1GSC081_4137 [Leptospira kirschneri str. H1]